MSCGQCTRNHFVRKTVKKKRHYKTESFELYFVLRVDKYIWRQNFNGPNEAQVVRYPKCYPNFIFFTN